MTATEASPARLGPLAGAVGWGVVVSGAFSIAIQGLAFAQSMLVPRLLGPAIVGLYAVGSATIRIGTLLKDFGVGQKVTQDDRMELPLAYSVAFTIEVALATVAFVILVAGAPVLASVLDQPDLTPVISVLAVTVYTKAFLSLTGSLHLRRLHYGRLNLVNAIGPVVAFVVTVPLAYAGAGVWSLVAGAVAAFLVATGVVLWNAPLRPQLRLDRPVVRAYLQFGWPVWLGNLLDMASTIGGSIVITHWVGFAGVGFFTVSQGFIQRAFHVDLLMAASLFPALARTQGDVAGHRRAFLVTNRVTVLWSGLVGFGLAVFAGDLIRFVFGSAWSPAEFLFRMSGLAVAIGSVGFSWDIFFRARGDTKPTLVFKAISETWAFVVLLPSIAIWGIDGAAWAVASLGVIVVPVRRLFIRRLFDDVQLVRTVWREVLALGAAAGAIVAIRTVWMPQSFGGFVSQGVLYLALAAVTVFALDGPFLREVLARVRPGNKVAAGAPAAPAKAAAGARGSGPALAHVAVPGDYPSGLALDGDRVWVTCRDSSTLAWMDLPDGAWQSKQLPAYPHLPAVSDGVAWAGLTLAGKVAAVDATGRTFLTRLARSKEILVTAPFGPGCLVVENGHRDKRLWTVPEPGAKASSRSLPEALVRPDFVIASTRPDGELWITDTASPAVARLEGDAHRMVEVPGGTRFGVRDEHRRLLWLGHTTLPAVSAISLDDPFEVVVHANVPSKPFGLALGPDERLWVACPQAGCVVALDQHGHTQDRIDTAPGAWPIGVAWWRGSLLILCAKSATLLVREMP